MAENIEIKATCADLQSVRRIVLHLATAHLGMDTQTDTYFKTNNGRFKFRQSRLSGDYLIPYIRHDQKGPKSSSYAKIDVDDSRVVKQLFEQILGVEIVVHKKREIFLYKNVRIHLDEVHGLGSFIELEAVCTEDSDRQEEHKKVNWLMEQLGITAENLLEASYENLVRDNPVHGL